MTACPICGADPCPNPSFCRSCREDDARRAKATGADGKPLLIIDPGNLPTVATHLRDILADSGALYNRGTPVRITLFVERRHADRHAAHGTRRC